MLDAAVLVEIERWPVIESRHRGSIAVVTPDGRLHAWSGNPSSVVLMRSVAKPIQALPLVDDEVAKGFGLTGSELAIIVASHSGEPGQVSQVESILGKIGLDSSSLRCGKHYPSDWSGIAEYDDSSVGVLQNNCSGKHAGMLAQCVARGFDLNTYELSSHPVQERILRTVALLAQVAVTSISVSSENCSAPVFGLPLERIALAYARLVNPAALNPKINTACKRIVDAMLDYPELVGARSGRICTEIMRTCARRIVAKGGAEGIYAMGVLANDRYPGGLGIAIKIEDGGERAVPPVAVEVLDQLELLTAEESSRLSSWKRKEIRSYRGIAVGEIVPVFQLKFA